MTSTLAGPGVGRRTAKASDDYVAEILSKMNNGQTLSRQAKVDKLALILSDETNGIKRLGVGMIGPIQLKLRYQGMTRNILIEDPITPGTPVEYDVFDDLGQAYIMSPHEGEVRITPFEGKRVPVSTFRLATRPAIRKEDLFSLRINAVEQVQDESKQSILKQEDARLMLMLQSSANAYASRADHVITPNHNVTEASGAFTPAGLYEAVRQTDMHELQSARILVNPYDFRDFYQWDINTTGWAFKDRVVAGETITTFGEFQFQRSIMVPAGTMYLTPQPNFLGVFPVLYSLDVQENHNVEAFWYGWVFDEMVGFAILNPRGIATVTKTAETPYGGVTGSPVGPGQGALNPPGRPSLGPDSP